MLVLLVLFLDLPWHGDVKCMLFLVPFEMYATIKIAHPVRGKFIFVFHTFNAVVYTF